MISRYPDCHQKNRSYVLNGCAFDDILRRETKDERLFRGTSFWTNKDLSRFMPLTRTKTALNNPKNASFGMLLS